MWLFLKLPDRPRSPAKKSSANLLKPVEESKPQTRFNHITRRVLLPLMLVGLSRRRLKNSHCVPANGDSIANKYTHLASSSTNSLSVLMVKKGGTVTKRRHKR